MTFKCKAVLNVAFAFTFISSQAYAGVGVTDTTPQCVSAVASSLATKCHEAAKTAGAFSGASQADGINKGAEDLTINQGIQKGLSADGIDKCKKAMDQCQPVCENAKGASKQTCDRFVSYAQELESGVASNDQGMQGSQATDDATTQSAGGSNMMGMLAGAAVGGLLGYMLAKKNNKDDDKDDDGALLPNGQIDCSKDDAYKYRDCTTYLEVNCMNSLDSEKCKQFAGVFCAASSSSSTSTQQPVDAPPLAESGAGVGTPFCKTNLAFNYCKAADRNQCPSCLGLARSNSAACQQDPSLCLAQNSPDQIATAKQSCPTDPAFADPAYASGGGSQVPTGLQTGAPAVVLPQSVNGSSASSATAAGGADSGGVREGQAGSVNSQANYQGSAVGTAGSASGGRELASAKGGSNFKTASTGPRPDVEGPFGPSLFRTSTEVIKSRCDAGKLNNCPNSN